jgi:GSH-dependent disulfide-bond oxidoreductase
MWQMAGFGPMLGQAAHFIKFAPERIPYAAERYSNEVKRLFGVLDRQLEDKEYIADKYSISDMACYPWSLVCSWMELSTDEFENVKRWQDTMAARPAVERGMGLLAEKRQEPKMDEKAREVLYGKK